MGCKFERSLGTLQVHVESWPAKKRAFAVASVAAVARQPRDTGESYSDSQCAVLGLPEAWRRLDVSQEMRDGRDGGQAQVDLHKACCWMICFRGRILNDDSIIHVPSTLNSYKPDAWLLQSSLSASQNKDALQLVAEEQDRLVMKATDRVYDLKFVFLILIFFFLDFFQDLNTTLDHTAPPTYLDTCIVREAASMLCDLPFWATCAAAKSGTSMNAGRQVSFGHEPPQ